MALTIEFTAQPINQQMEPSFFAFDINKSRAISTTRTIFRLNTNQSHAYED